MVMERDNWQRESWHRDLDSRDGLLVLRARDGDGRATAELVDIYCDLTRHHLDAATPPVPPSTREVVIAAVRDGLHGEIRAFQRGVSFHKRWLELLRREIRFARAGTVRAPMAECW